MCYFLYGAVNEGCNAEDYNKATKGAKYRFHFGDVNAVNDGVKNCDERYRITFTPCDCDTAIGKKHTNKKQLKELQALLLDLRKVRDIRYLLISKNWWEEQNDRQETVHIDDIDILHFLANIEDNCLYKIELYKKYY